MISATDRLSAVLARDEQLIDVLVNAAPAFETLRNPAMRKQMATRVTVEQAAQIAGLDAAVLVERLNSRLESRSPATESAPPPPAPIVSTPVPAELLAIPPELLVDVDVREQLRAGIEPFAEIMSAARTLGPGAVLRIRAIFEPAPLYAVFAKQGLTHFTEQFAADDWRVWFYRDGSAAAPSSAPAISDEGEEDVIVLDVRGLEPPEPMIRTFEALAEMPRGKTLMQINVRVPQFLLPKLDAQGFVYEIREQSADLVRLFIRHKTN